MKKDSKLCMENTGKSISVYYSAFNKREDVAHINEDGKITYYVSDEHISFEDKQLIERTAKEKRENFIREWHMMSESQKYNVMRLKILPLDEAMKMTRDKSRTVSEKIKEFEKKYLDI